MRKKKLWLSLGAVMLVLALIFTGGAWYVSDYYSADSAAIAAYAEKHPVTETQYEDMISYGTGDEDTALIFYPGGKVEYTAYAPLCMALAENGIFCVLLKMPFHLAVLDPNAADPVRACYPQMENWYIGGHSLGGSMAASYLGKHASDYRGLLLLGSYAANDLSQSGLTVLSIYGSEDGVMNREKYAANLANLPQDVSQQVIRGGCHAYFGMYGKQKGDGIPTVTAEEQIDLTAGFILEWIGKGQGNAQNH